MSKTISTDMQERIKKYEKMTQQLKKDKEIQRQASKISSSTLMGIPPGGFDSGPIPKKKKKT